MNRLSKAIALVTLTGAGIAQAELSATVGAVSEYYFRGVNLGDAGAYASLDYEAAGFYVGTWWIDDAGTVPGNDGLETDFYLGYGQEYEDSGFSWNIGYNRYEYTYTGDFENEFALSFGLNGFGIEYVLGVEEDEFDTTDGTGGETEQDYDLITLSYNADNWGILVAQFTTDDADGFTTGEAEYKYAEFSASQEVAGIDFGLTIGTAFDGEANSMDVPTAGGEYIVLDLSKGFDL